MTAPGGPPAPDWWMASDGRWYPPDPAEAPAESPADTAPVPEPATVGTTSSWLRKPFVPIGIAVVAVLVLGLGVTQLTGGDDEPMTTEDVLENAPPIEDLDDEPRAPGVDAEIGLTTSSGLDVELEDLDDAPFEGVDYQLTVAGAGLTDRIERPGNTMDAADGETFLVLRYNLIGHQNGFKPEAAIHADGEPLPFELSTGDNTFVRAIDADVELEDLGLQITDRATDQTMSLATGRMVGDYPEVLYRPTREITVRDRLVAPFTITLPEGHGCAGAGGELTVVFNDAELAWTGLDAHVVPYAYQSDPLEVVPPPEDGGRAWLLIGIEVFSALGPEFTCTYSPEIPAQNLVVVADDGTEYVSELPLTNISPYLVFEVPADVGRVALHLRPSEGVVDGRNPAAAYSFGASTQPVPIAFPPVRSTP